MKSPGIDVASNTARATQLRSREANLSKSDINLRLLQRFNDRIGTSSVLNWYDDAVLEENSRFVFYRRDNEVAREKETERKGEEARIRANVYKVRCALIALLSARYTSSIYPSIYSSPPPSSLQSARASSFSSSRGDGDDFRHGVELTARSRRSLPEVQALESPCTAGP